MKKSALLCILLLQVIFGWSQVIKAPEVKEGLGPFPQLIIRGATLINGNGAPPIGPVDIVVENNRIKSVTQVGYPGIAID
ncbi:MAG: amidohydrolase, partial [Saprospiraceae bacterium]